MIPEEGDAVDLQSFVLYLLHLICHRSHLKQVEIVVSVTVASVCMLIVHLLYFVSC